MKIKTVYYLFLLLSSITLLTGCASSQTIDNTANLNASISLNLMPGDSNMSHSLVFLDIKSATTTVPSIQPVSCQIYYNNTLLSESSDITFDKELNHFVVHIDLNAFDSIENALNKTYTVIFTYKQSESTLTLTDQSTTAGAVY